VPRSEGFAWIDKSLGEEFVEGKNGAELKRMFADVEGTSTRELARGLERDFGGTILREGDAKVAEGAALMKRIGEIAPEHKLRFDGIQPGIAGYAEFPDLLQFTPQVKRDRLRERHSTLIRERLRRPYSSIWTRCSG